MSLLLHALGHSNAHGIAHGDQDVRMRLNDRLQVAGIIFAIPAAEHGQMPVRLLIEGQFSRIGLIIPAGQ